MKVVLAFLLLIFVAEPVAASAEGGTRNEAVAMVASVIEMFDQEGAEKTFKAISDKSFVKFHDRDLYPFVYKTDGVCVAHGARPALIGKNLYDLKDQDGKYLIREMIQRSREGKGWIKFKWPNPLTNKIEDKTSYFAKLGDDYLVGVGIYDAAQ
jgi:cytochrome c